MCRSVASLECPFLCSHLHKSEYPPRGSSVADLHLRSPRGYRFERGEVSALSRAPGSHLRPGLSTLRMRGSFPRAFEHFFK
jgi:hypothetical protein